MNYKSVVFILIAALCLIGCKDNSLAGILVEGNTPIINSSGILTESIGIETLGGTFTPIITAGIKQPTKVSKIFSTAVDNQNQIMIKIFRGESQLTKDTTPLGIYVITGIRPAPRGEPQIEIIFQVEKLSIKLLAKDLGTGKEVKIVKQ